jgi:hypothetical protein
MLTVLGGLAEFEHELILVRAGAPAATARRHWACASAAPPSLTPHQRREAMKRLAQGCHAGRAGAFPRRFAVDH